MAAASVPIKSSACALNTTAVRLVRQGVGFTRRNDDSPARVAHAAASGISGTEMIA